MSALYRQWRPQSWEGIVGQDHVVTTLRNAIAAGRMVHAYLFSGPRGTGKTTTARILAKSLDCLHDDLNQRPCNACKHCAAISAGAFLDLIEIDAASNTSVDDVRELRDRINFAPNKGPYKVYIIDEVHMLSSAAFNALLKTLEEPPDHAVFVLATTEVHKVPATVLSRCQRHEFRRIPYDTILAYLKEKTAEEGMSVEADALELIARQSTGSLRDAISLLDQLISPGDTLTLDRAQLILGSATTEAVIQTVDAWVRGNAGEGLGLINRALDGGADPRQFARQIVEYLRSLLLMRMGNSVLVDYPTEVQEGMGSQNAQVSLERLLAGIHAFSTASMEKRASWQSSLPLEMAFVETIDLSEGQGGSSEGSKSGGPAESRIVGELVDTTVPDENPSTSDPSQAEDPPPAPESEIQDSDPPSGELTFADIMGRWREVLQAAREIDPRAQALLNSCRPLGLQKGALVIGFSSDLLREKMEKGHNTEVASGAIQAVFGETLGIRCVLSELWENGMGGNDSPTALTDGGMVATAIRELGAKVVEVEKLPPEGYSDPNTQGAE